MRRAIVFYRPIEVSNDLRFARRYRVVLECQHRSELDVLDRDMQRVLNGKPGFTECKRCPPPIVIEEDIKNV